MPHVEDPTAWFERLYRDADDGRAIVPWDREAPSALLVEWVEAKSLDGAGQSAVVVGCGPGRDAELVARLGFDTVAFDVSPTAITIARERHPDSPVDYQVADLRDLPPAWRHRFDLVVESMTVQSLPLELRAVATRAIGELTAPGGTTLVIAVGREEGEDVEGPPWPLSRSEIEAFALPDLAPVAVEDIPDADEPSLHRWRAEFRRRH
ncbi:class I SAM-dependent methyltransferase [Aeromicrobium sp.]|uniref:class I SAM-dependent methyltransferase n=1 Tax=Aeromicrobium sp. TaxID=1871063 RepID=UPI003D6B3211